MLSTSINQVQKLTKSKQRTTAELERDTKQLIRLERLIDFIFAILIWQLFQNLPVPSAEEFDKHTNLELLNAVLYFATGTPWF